ncbi:hypothetical protein C0J52_01065, partial [Blattella germanica]
KNNPDLFLINNTFNNYATRFNCDLRTNFCRNILTKIAFTNLVLSYITHCPRMLEILM